jgi:hypothetical protein
MPLNLLDYGKPNPFGEIIGKCRHLAWPVNAYRVTLPEVLDDGDSINPFERLILKMIEAGSGSDPEMLEQETCIPKYLIQCVLLRLQDKAFIDEHNEIINQTCDRWKDKEKSSRFVTALLFREMSSGKILPFFHWLDENNPLQKKEAKKGFKKIHYEGSRRNSIPTSRDVVSALQAMKKRSMAFEKEPRLPTVQQIKIAQDPELYYLDCPIAIQKSDGEFRIADPFGNGFSLIFENAFSRMLEQDDRLSDWLMNWKQSMSNPRQSKQVPTQKEPYDNDTNQGRYPNLVSSLRLRGDAQYRSIEQIYASLEWAMFYACAQRPYDVAISQLRLSNQSEHPNLLKRAADKIGMDLPKNGLRLVKEGKIIDFLAGKAEMWTILSIALLMAENDEEHSLRRIASKNPDFIIQLFEVKNKRDPRRHGKGKVQKHEIELQEEAFMREMVTALLPSIRFSDTHIVEVNKDSIADALLDARISIQNEFGFGLFNRLGGDLQNRLIYAECFWFSCDDGDNAQPFVSDLYAILQKKFRKKLFGMFPPDIKDSEFSIMAQQNANLSGLGQLSTSLCTVRPDSIRTTLQGNDQTLGACVIALLLMSDNNLLRTIADTQPSFLFDVSEIIIWGGHGNEPLPLTKADIGKLRKSTYSTIKTLLEI